MQKVRKVGTFCQGVQINSENACFMQHLTTRANTTNLSATPTSSLSRAITQVFLNRKKVNALVDTGSSERFRPIRDNVVASLKIPTVERKGVVSMASTAFTTPISGACHVTSGNFWEIISECFAQHCTVTIQRWGSRPRLHAETLKREFRIW